MPLLYGESFIGRGEISAERKTGTLVVKKHLVLERYKTNNTIANSFEQLFPKV
ncbi:hypothetical protein [Bacillus sp. NPDC077027]|uniref:hypothetical protein n=1 Tax=Bacillus sp. NPDC077027 TaxID=3390548 RepID=UPI003D060B16